MADSVSGITKAKPQEHRGKRVETKPSGNTCVFERGVEEERLFCNPDGQRDNNLSGEALKARGFRQLDTERI